MNGHDLVSALNRLLEAELTALEYYQIHAESITQPEIAEGVAAIIPAEQGHAVSLAVRIRELGGAPAPAGGPATLRGREMGETSRAKGTEAMLALELEQEQQAIKDYAAHVADLVDDMVTLEMLEEQLFDEMRHAKWLKQTMMALKADDGRQGS